MLVNPLSPSCLRTVVVAGLRDRDQLAVARVVVVDVVDDMQRLGLIQLLLGEQLGLVDWDYHFYIAVALCSFH